jgi:ribosomal protein S18 acetylase RimI-like enzyme
MLTERPAATLDIAALAALFSNVYADYYVPLHVDATAMAGMIAAQDLDLERSCVVFDGSDPIAFAMLAVRGQTGWIGGMGVVPGHRRGGLGRRVMKSAIGAARDSGLDRVGLEVLEPNEPAAALYRELGFRQVRWLEVFERAPQALPEEPGPLPPTGRAEVRDILDQYDALHREPPPWQRWPVVIERAAASLTAVATRDAGGVITACALSRGDAKRQLLLAAGERPAATPGSLAACVRACIDPHPEATVMMVNVPERDPAASALHSLGFHVRIRQREMALDL